MTGTATAVHSGLMLLVAACAVAAQPMKTDAIWVQKAERKLHLMKDYEVIRSFPIALGQNPAGHKQREGDSRTPEGFYFIDGRKADSDFYRALHISYPDEADVYLARERRRPPGGAIMIHGEPNEPGLRGRLKKDWTDGCIGLKNSDMRIVWQAVDKGTPVLIDP